MIVRIKYDRIEFLAAGKQPRPQIFKLSGLAKNDRFITEEYVAVASGKSGLVVCRVDRGIFAVFSRANNFITILPERVKLTPAAARELLARKSLPPPRRIKNALVIALSKLIAAGASWSVATSVLGVSSNGHSPEENTNLRLTR